MSGSTSTMAERDTIIGLTPEAEILRAMEELIRKLAAGKADQNDIQLLQELQKRRVDLMRPRVAINPETIPA